MGALEFPVHLSSHIGNFIKCLHRESREMDLKVKQEYLEKAVRLHEENPVVDAHLDLAGEILLRQKNGERDIVKKKRGKAGSRVGKCAFADQST